MRRECQERFTRHRLQKKPLLSYPGMHHGTCVTYVPWCMSGSLTRGGGETLPAFPTHAQPSLWRIWQEVHAWRCFNSWQWQAISKHKADEKIPHVLLDSKDFENGFVDQIAFFKKLASEIPLGYFKVQLDHCSGGHLCHPIRLIQGHISQLVYELTV